MQFLDGALEIFSLVAEDSKYVGLSVHLSFSEMRKRILGRLLVEG